MKHHFPFSLNFGIQYPSSSLELPVAPEPAQPIVTTMLPLRQTCTAKRHGFVTHTFNPETMLRSWLLSRYLSRIRSDLSNVISLVADLCFERKFAADLKQALSDGTLQLPSASTLQRTSTKVNALDLLYQRELHKTLSFARYCSPDSSRKGKHNLFALLEDRISWPLKASSRERFDIDVDAA